MDNRDQDKVVAWLERLADQSGWNTDVWQKCHDLVTANLDNELLEYVFDDVIHYNGEFHSRNILGISVNSSRLQLEQYRLEFRDIAAALRSGLSLIEARNKYGL
jgi:hypothetical protein